MINVNGKYEILKDRHGLAIGALDISKDPGACLRLCKKIYEREALRYEGEIKKTK